MGGASAASRELEAEEWKKRRGLSFYLSFWLKCANAHVCLQIIRVGLISGLPEFNLNLV